MASVREIPRDSSTPRVTAGFTWQPETGPRAYARASSTRPKARATTTGPPVLMPATAEPTPTRTSSAVPTNSASSWRRRVGDIRGPPRRPRPDPAHVFSDPAAGRDQRGASPPRRARVLRPQRPRGGPESYARRGTGQPPVALL